MLSCSSRSKSLSHSAAKTMRPTKVRPRVGSRMSGSSARPMRSVVCADAVPAQSARTAAAKIAMRRRIGASVHLEVLQPHQAVGDGPQPAQLGGVPPQPVAVIEVDDRPVLLDRDGGDLVENGLPLGDVQLRAGLLEQLVDVLAAI